jgi:hypothetical protein
MKLKTRYVWNFDFTYEIIYFIYEKVISYMKFQFIFYILNLYIWKHFTYEILISHMKLFISFMWFYISFMEKTIFSIFIIQLS